MKKCVLALLGFFVSCAVFAGEFSSQVPLPGNSVANTKLQYDTLMPVYMLVSTKVDNCDSMSVIDTKVTRKPYDLKSVNGRYTQGQWNELWTVKACGKTAKVPIKFVLDSTGASYVISENKIVIK